MSGVLLRMGVIAAVAVSLAGCGNDPAKNGLTATVGHSVGAALTSTRGPAQPVVVTRAMIRALKVPILMFGLPSRKARLAMATDGHNGDVVTWRAADGSTVSLRSGVVVATRGAGSDLMSAAVPSLAQLECMRRHCPIDFACFCRVTGLPEGLGQQTEIWHGGWWGWFCGAVRGGGASAGEPALA